MQSGEVEGWSYISNKQWSYVEDEGVLKSLSADKKLAVALLENGATEQILAISAALDW